MMHGIVLGIAVLVSSPGVSPVVEPPRAIVVPAAITFDLPTGESSRPVWRRGTLPVAQPTRAKRHNTTDRIIAVAAGATVGFLAGGVIGGKITDRSKENPDDDTSVLKGVMIGAPIGAVVGAVIGWRLTRN